MPPSVQLTTKDSRPNTSRLSRRRLVFLLATATIASGLGVALGSTLRFQVLSVSEAPIFKPQQDFPPLAEWPPQVPLTRERDSFDTRWEYEAPTQQLIYEDRSKEDIGNINTDESAYSEDFTPESATIPDVAPNPIPANLNDEDTSQDPAAEIFDEEYSPPVVSTSTGDLDSDSNTSDELPSNDESLDESTPPWFDKEPVSESQLKDGPLIISPDEPFSSPYSLPE